MKFRLAAALLAVAGVYPPPVLTAQTPTPDALVAKATAYVHEFVRLFANVVAEERYEQQITVPRRKRLLTSDFLLVRYPGDELWQAFRDVSEVDGKPVGDRENRIMKLFTQPSSNALRRAGELANASTRYNLLNVGTLSNPMLAIAFLQNQYYARFRFNLAGIDKKLGPDVRTVRFVEFQSPSLIKGNGNADVMSRGLLWIEEGTGRVVKTELQLGSTAAPIRIITTFAFDQDLGINVPAMMEDWYPDGTGEFRGKATYGKFRRFQVQTEETVAAPTP